MNNPHPKKYIQVGRLLFRINLSNKPPNVFDNSGNPIYLLFLYNAHKIQKLNRLPALEARTTTSIPTMVYSSRAH